MKTLEVTDATFDDDETDYMLAELHDEIRNRMLVLDPGQRLVAEIALPSLVRIVVWYVRRIVARGSRLG